MRHVSWAAIPLQKRDLQFASARTRYKYSPKGHAAHPKRSFIPDILWSTSKRAATRAMPKIVYPGKLSLSFLTAVHHFEREVEKSLITLYFFSWLATPSPLHSQHVSYVVNRILIAASQLILFFLQTAEGATYASKHANSCFRKYQNIVSRKLQKYKKMWSPVCELFGSMQMLKPKTPCPNKIHDLCQHFSKQQVGTEWLAGCRKYEVGEA